MGDNLEKFAELGDRWSGWAKIVATLVALLALLGFGSFFYNQVWQKKSLTYTILPSYDLEDRAFGGLVIENRGRVALTDVQIILADLEAPIESLRIPGAHEPVNIIDGGEGHNSILMELPRFSKGASLPIYMVTSGSISLEPGPKFLVTSAETVGEASADPSSEVFNYLILLASASIVFFVLILTVWKDSRRTRSMELWIEAKEAKITELEAEVTELEAETTELLAATAELKIIAAKIDEDSAGWNAELAETRAELEMTRVRLKEQKTTQPS